jgi:DNA-directed RNA polymerase subunit alpha
MKTPDLQKLCKLSLDEKIATKFYGRFIAEPFERGYGHTIGNSLRRVLLSSLRGAAITSVKIAGALHEFTVLKGVKEDVAEIILNLKKIRVKLNSEGPEKLYLKVEKAGRVTAGDIEANANVEIMNPDQEIASIDVGTVLEMELEVSSGKGYVLAEEINLDKYPIGTIVLDSLFSPIAKVNYEVENTRVGQTLNYDKLVMEIWTDGSISPENALIQAAKILRKSLVIFMGDKTDFRKAVEEETSMDAVRGQQIFGQPIEIMNLSVRALKSLKNAGIETIGDLVQIKEEEILNFDKIGKRLFEEIKSKLEKLNLSIGMGINDGVKG